MSINSQYGLFGQLVPHDANNVLSSYQKTREKLASNSRIGASAYAAQGALYSFLNTFAYPIVGAGKILHDVSHCQLGNAAKDGFSAVENTFKSVILTVASLACAIFGLVVPSALKMLQVPTKGETADAAYLANDFPELGGKGLKNIFVLRFDNPEVALPSSSSSEQMFDVETNQKLDSFVDQLIANKPKDRPLTGFNIIDLNNDFTDGGSLEIEGGKAKFLAGFREILKRHQQKSLFDYIVLTKDFHPLQHKSFTSTYYTVKEVDAGDGKVGFEVTPNKEGEHLGANLREFWKKGKKYEIRKGENGGTILIPDADGQKNLDKIRQGFKDGTLLPYTQMLQPIPVTPHMFEKAKRTEHDLDVNEAFNQLRDAGIFDLNGVINPDATYGGIKLRDAFTSNVTSQFDENFAYELSDKIGYSEGRIQALLQCLTEDIWQNHCVQGGTGHECIPEMLGLIAQYAPNTPIVPISKGNVLKFGESYSAVLNTAGNLASPLIGLVKRIQEKCDKQRIEFVNYVCGLATGYCPSNTAFDLKLLTDGAIYYLTGLSKGVDNGAYDEGVHDKLSMKGIHVKDTI